MADTTQPERRPSMICDARALEPCRETVDALARAALEAQRHGLQLRLRRPSAQLCELIDAMGLGEVLRE